LKNLHPKPLALNLKHLTFNRQPHTKNEKPINPKPRLGAIAIDEGVAHCLSERGT